MGTLPDLQVNAQGFVLSVVAQWCRSFMKGNKKSQIYGTICLLMLKIEEKKMCVCIQQFSQKVLVFFDSLYHAPFLQFGI